MPELFNHPLAIVDVETTGMSYTHGGVIDIGILRVENGQVVQTMRQLINPGSPLPVFISQLTGISNEDVADAPMFADVAHDVYDLLEDCIFIAHNVRFDYAFIKEEFNRVGLSYRPKQLCTVRLSKSLYPQHRHHKLDALIERFGINIHERHRAFADAQATWESLQKMATQHSEAIFNKYVAMQLKQPSLPANIAPETVKDLPDTPGVYIFEGQNGATLYVGKSVDIRSRVMSHFSDDHRSPKEMRIAQEITNIRTIQTTGELGALLKESQLIKELMPIHNRMLRRQTGMVLAIKDENEYGYPTIKLERKSEVLKTKLETNQSLEKRNVRNGRLSLRHSGPEQSEGIESQWSYQEESLQDDAHFVSLDSIMAVFKSERQAKESLIALAKEHKLCHKLLGLQKTSGACFPHQLKICQGACVGKESSLEYLFRFNQAFNSSRIKQWPFTGAIAITETSSVNSSTTYIIDNWCLTGIIEQRDQDVEHLSVDPTFDLDQYKIFKRFVENPKNRPNIKPYDVAVIASDLY